MTPFLIQASRVAEDAGNQMELAKVRRAAFVQFLKEHGSEIPDFFVTSWHGTHFAIHFNFLNTATESEIAEAIQAAGKLFGLEDWKSTPHELSKVTPEGISVTIRREKPAELTSLTAA